MSNRTITKPASPNAEPAPLAVGVKDAAQMLSLSERLLWTLTNQSLIPHVRVGKRVIYPVNLLNDWLEKQAKKRGGGK